MEERNDSEQRIIRERRRARKLGHAFWIVLIIVGILGWAFWKWYALPISFGVAFLLGNVYSYLLVRKVEKETGLGVMEQDDVLRGVPQQVSEKEGDFLGFHHDGKGQLVFDLTDEEKARVRETFAVFENYKVDPNYADEIQKALVCLSLLDLGHEYWNQASPMRTRLPAVEVKEDVDRLLEKTLAAYAKAFSIYSMKPILVLMATTFITMGNRSQAKACLEDYFTYTRPPEYSDGIIDFFVQYFLKTFGRDSLEEMDDDAKQLLSTLEKG